MKRRKGKILSGCLAFIMMFSQLAAPVFAADGRMAADEPKGGQVIYLPVIEEGNNVSNQKYGISSFNTLEFTTNVEGYTYAYIGEDNIYINKEIVIFTEEEPAANGLLQIIDEDGEVLASSSAINSYYESRTYDETNGEWVTDYWYTQYITIQNTSDIPPGTYDLQLSAGNEIYNCSGGVIVVGDDSLLIKSAYIEGLNPGAGTFEVNMQLYGFETEEDLNNLSFQLLDDDENIVAKSHGDYRFISAGYNNNCWDVYAQMRVEEEFPIKLYVSYSLKIIYTGHKELVDGVGAVTRNAYEPSISIEDFQVTDPQRAEVDIVLKNWEETKNYRIYVKTDYDGAELASFEGIVPEDGIIQVKLLLNGIAMPLSSHESQFCVYVYEEDNTYWAAYETFENIYYYLDEGSCYIYPYYIKPSAGQFDFNIEYHDCSYVRGQDDVISMRDSDGTEVGKCTSVINTRDGSSGILSGTLKITGDLNNKETYYIYLNNILFDTIWTTDELAISNYSAMTDYSSSTFWTNLSVFPVELNAINSNGSGFIVFKDGDKDVLSSGKIDGKTSEYFDHLLYTYTFNFEEIAKLISGHNYALVFRDTSGEEKTLYASSGMTYVGKTTALDFSNNNHAYIAWHNSKVGDSTIETRIYFGNNSGPKNITEIDLENAVKLITLSKEGETIPVTGYQNGAWDGSYYEAELILQKALTAGEYYAYFGVKQISSFTVDDIQHGSPRVSGAEINGGYVYGYNLPEDEIYTAKLYKDYACITETPFSMTLQGENNGKTQYLYFPRAVLADLESGNYEMRIFIGSKILGSVTINIKDISRPVVTVMDDKNWQGTDPVMHSENIYISCSNLSTYSYIRFAETEDELAEKPFVICFSGMNYNYKFEGEDGERTLFAVLSKTGNAADTDNLDYTFNLWLCRDEDYDLQVPESIQGIQREFGNFTISATTELPATNVWVAFYDAYGEYATRQMSYLGRDTDENQHRFGLTFDVGSSFYDYYYNNKDAQEDYEVNEFFYENTQSIKVFATDLSNVYNHNENYRGNIMGAEIERVLVFGNPDYIILPQFAKGEVLINKRVYNIFGYATPFGEVSIYMGDNVIGTSESNGYGYFSVSLEGLPDGKHILEISDNCGVYAEAASVLIVDTTPPSIENIGFTFLDGSNAVVHWSCEDKDVDYYLIYKNGALLGRTDADKKSYNVMASAGEVNTFTVKAVDRAGNTGEMTVSTADSEIPTAPGNLTMTEKTTTSVTLSWTEGTDNMGIAGYNVYADGIKVGETGGTALTHTVTGLMQGTEYSFTVKTRDIANNLSADSEVLTVSTVGLNLSSPDLETTYIVDEFYDKKIPVSFNVYADEEDYSVTLSKGFAEYKPADEDDTSWQSESMACTENTANGKWDISGDAGGYLPMGSYQVRFTAEDIFGGKVESNPINVVLLKRDDVPPTVPGKPVPVSRSTKTLTFSWDASEDNVMVTAYDIYRDGILAGSVTGADTQYTDAGLEMGKTYMYTVKARDARNNTSNASEETNMTTATLSFATVKTLDSIYIADEQENKKIPVSADVSGDEDYRPEVTVALQYKPSAEITWGNCSEDILASSELLPYRFNGSWSIAGNTDDYITGTYNVRYKLSDIHGAEVYSEVQNILIKRDDVKPEIEFTHPIAEKTYGGSSIGISGKATDNAAVNKVVLSYSANSADYTDITTISNEDDGFDKLFNWSYEWDASLISSGEITLRAIAYDNLNNYSQTLCIITVDNTPPESPAGLNVTSDANKISVLWSKDTVEEDFYEFYIYRSNTEDGEFELVKTTENIGYFDDAETGIEEGIRYYYYVTSVDIYGNESEPTQTLWGIMENDITAPRIVSYLPKTGGTLCHTAEFTISAADNFKLSSIDISYRKGEGAWNTIASLPADTKAYVARYDWDIKDMEEGIYQIRFMAADSAGLISDETIADYIIKAYELPVSPVLTGTAGHKSAELSWTYGGDDSLVKSYDIYHSSSEYGDYTQIHTTKDKTWSHVNLPVDITNWYKVEVRDKYDETAISNAFSVTPVLSDTEPPAAKIILKNPVVALGKSLVLDGTASFDNDIIKEYKWEIDGNEHIGSKLNYTFTAAGIFSVTLSVIDDSGNVGTDSAEVTVIDTSLNTDYVDMNITVLDAGDGVSLLKDAEIQIKNEEGTVDIALVSNNEGEASVLLQNGTYTVSTIAEGYNSRTSSLTVTPENKSVKIGMSRAHMVKGSLTASEMSLEEILAAGIDTSDPDNIHVYKGALVLEFTPQYPSEKPRTLKYNVYYNNTGKLLDIAGGLLGGWGFNFGGGFSGTVYPVNKNVYMIVYTETCWLKEMFDVELLVVNDSAVDTIEDCTAALELPDGLSLASMKFDQQSLKLDIGTIDSKETASAKWYVRGDKEGSYNLTALVSGVFMPNPEPFEVNFVTKEPIKVLAGSALHMYIKADKYAAKGLTYTIDFELSNVSNKDLYYVSLNVLGAEFMREFKAEDLKNFDAEGKELKGNWNDGVPLYAEKLAPGKSLKGQFRVIFDDEIIESGIRYMLTKAFMHTMPGSTAEIGCTIDLRDNTFNYSSSYGGDAEGTFYYDDSFFDLGSGTYNHDLAAMSLCMAMAAYNSSKAPALGYDAYTAGGNIKALLEKNEFENVELESATANYGGKPGDDSIAAAIASKQIESYGHEYTLIAVAVRGRGYEHEWHDNFLIGANPDHAGFSKAAGNVIYAVNNYIEKHGITGNVKVWITGYSRGAATANMAAARIVDGALSDNVSLISQGHVYGYSFETPANTRSNYANASKYRNIYSVVNPVDPVPMVAPAPWGYTRYGTTYYLPSAGLDASYSKYQQMLTNSYAYVTGQKYELDGFQMKKIINVDTDLNDGDGVSVKIMADDNNSGFMQETFLENYLNIIFMQGFKSKEDYLIYYENALCDLIGEIAGGSPEERKELADGLLEYIDWPSFWQWTLDTVGSIEHLKKDIAMYLSTSPAVDMTYDEAETLMDKLENVLINCVLKHPNYALTMMSNVSYLGQAHYAELCLAWMQMIQDAESYQNGVYRQLLTNCPVDMDIYEIRDGERILAARFKDKIVQKIPGSTIISYVDEDGQMIVILPQNGEYISEIAATDDGQLNYVLMEKGISSGIMRMVNHYSIPVVKGDILTGKIEDLTKLSEGQQAAYSLTDENGILQPDEELKGDEIVYHNVVLKVEGSGAVLGAGSRVHGFFAQITAIPDEGKNFGGWYIGGKKVSEDAEYRFCVLNDITLTAKFTSPSGGSGSGGSHAVDSGTSLSPEINYAEGGSVVTDKNNNFVIKPDDGYVIETIIINGVPVNVPADGILTGLKPTDKVEIIFGKITGCDGGDNCPSRLFIDVDKGKWYHRAVDYVISAGLFSGTSDITFSPEENMNRAMLVTVLWRLDGKPYAEDAGFTDLTSDWYKTAVSWAANNGIVEGYGNNTFGPENIITREQLAAVLYRYAKYKGYDVSGTIELAFRDAASISDWAVTPMKWAAAAKLIQGDGMNIMPLEGAQRAQVAAILQRFIENVK